nr:MAG: ORF1 [TTV-like mini virus]
MPPYWRNYWRRKRNPRFRRRWLFRRRIRKVFPRRRKYRTRRHRFYKVKRRFFFNKRKKKTIKLKVFQPNTINKCKIKGYKCLFQGSTYRLSKNYIQSIYATNPESYPSGGGWSLLVFSLDSLYEDFQHLENFWTKSNAGLPLIRYNGCKFKLYQAENVDYAFAYDNCWPLVDTPHTHADSSPSRMLVKKHKIIVPSRKNQPRKKPYKTVRIKPPPQMTNNWYFAQDLHKLPLVMTTTTSLSLTTPFCNPTANSNNITLKFLNPYMFQNPNFQHFNEQQGYIPKWIPISNVNTPIFYYASSIPHTTPTSLEFIKQLIFLGNTKDNQPGTELRNIIDNESQFPNTKKNWGNPFYHRYLETGEETTSYIYFSTTGVVDMVNKAKTNTQPDQIKNINFTLTTGPIIYTATYNPARDKGEKNTVYLVPTIDQNNLNKPQNENLIFYGFPLPILLWGWTDWVKKLKLANNFENDYTLIIDTDMFDEKLPHYWLLDETFIHGSDPYDFTNEYQKNYYNKNNWFPNLRYQVQSIEKICQTDVGTYKPQKENYIQAYCIYTFYFKFGGCPKTIPKPYDPSLQPTWTTADHIPRRPEIQNPNTNPQSELYSWDWDEDYVTENAIKRIKEFTTTNEYLLSTENKFQPQIQKKTKETTEQEKKEKLLLFLQHLRKHNLLLQLKQHLRLKK